MNTLISKATFLLLLLSSLISVNASQRVKSILRHAPEHYYVIQVASYLDGKRFQDMVNEIKLDKGLIAVKTTVNNKERWAILEGIYPNKDEATLSAQNIKQKHPHIKPWIRSVSSLKKDFVEPL
ncbi:MAG: hypothetical protein HWD86_09755 [Kangiellaceae bacterium]|nr:hypothetical protein [Kangiellaceae bacterium]